MTRLLLILTVIFSWTITHGQTDSSKSVKSDKEKYLDYIILKEGKGDTIWCNITKIQDYKIFYTEPNVDEWGKNIDEIKSYMWVSKNEIYIYEKPKRKPNKHWRDIIVLTDTSVSYSVDCMRGETHLEIPENVEKITDLPKRNLNKVKKIASSWSGHFVLVYIENNSEPKELYMLGLDCITVYDPTVPREIPKEFLHKIK
jgi:hypothetical protein